MLSDKKLAKLKRKLNAKYHIKGQLEEFLTKYPNIKNIKIIDNGYWTDQDMYPSARIEFDRFGVIYVFSYPATCSTAIIANVNYIGELGNMLPFAEDWAKLCGYCYLLLQNTSDRDYKMKGTGFSKLTEHLNTRTHNRISTFEKILN